MLFKYWTLVSRLQLRYLFSWGGIVEILIAVVYFKRHFFSGYESVRDGGNRELIKNYVGKAQQSVLHPSVDRICLR